MADNGVAPGTPSWVDLATPDIEASSAFYGALLGWRAEKSPVPEAGGYTLFHRADGKMVAGAAPLMDPNQPPAWTTYVSVASADDAAAAAKEAGGNVFMGPMDVMDQGRMALLMDPTGAALGLWQPGVHRGADVFNEPGAICWNELATRDVTAASDFYERVFGWASRTSGEGEQAYTEYLLDGRSIAGMMSMQGRVPEEVPPHWLVYFAVDDCEAAVAGATGLGAQVVVPPTTIPQGTFSVMIDPQGATFAVISAPK